MKKPIISALSAMVGAAVGAGAIGKKLNDRLETVRSYRDKHLALFLMMNDWVKIKQEGKNLSSYFESNGYKKIAIYGMSYAGETLVAELEGSSVQIAYGIDRNANSICADFAILSVEDELEEVDAIVVTAITFFDEIADMLSEKVECPVISLEDVLYSV